jgi:hypothetical protein
MMQAADLNWLSSKVSAVGPFQCVQRVLEQPIFGSALGQFRASAREATRRATIHNEPEFSELFMSYLLSEWPSAAHRASPASIEGASRATFTKSCVPLRTKASLFLSRKGCPFPRRRQGEAGGF